MGDYIGRKKVRLSLSLGNEKLGRCKRSKDPEMRRITDEAMKKFKKLIEAAITSNKTRKEK